MDKYQPTLKDYLTIIFKRKRLILFVFFLTIFLVVASSLLVRPKYEAKAQVLVKFGRENLYTPPNEANRYLVQNSREDQILPEIELIKSRSLAEKVLEVLGTQYVYGEMEEQDALVALQESISATAGENSNVINITYRHTLPEVSSKVLNTLVSLYMEYHLKIHQNPASYNFFEEQSKLLKNNLESSEDRLNHFKKQHKLTFLEDEQRLLLTQIANLTDEINTISGVLVETDNRINQLRIQLKDIPQTVSQGEEVQYSPDLIRNLQEKLVDLELKENELLTKYTPESRLIQAVKSEIIVLKQKLAESESKRYGVSITGPNETYTRLQEDLYQSLISQKAISEKLKTKESQLITLKQKLDELNKVEVKFNRLNQAVDVDRQNYKLYLSKFEEARILNEMDKKKISNVSLIQSALVPFRPVRPDLKLNFILSLFLGLVGGIIMAFFVEYFDDTIEQPADVVKLLELPVITSIPDFGAEYS